MKANILFHQGWTDIINCLPLINYNSSIYEEIYLFIRDDSQPMIDFYCRNLKNIKIIYEKKENIDYNLIKILNNFSENENVFFGIFDTFNLKNNNSFLSNRFDFFFVQKFYECYNIPYMTRVDSFDFERDLEIEEKKFNEFVKKNGEDYILIHEDRDRNLLISVENTNKYNIVNIDKITDIFFDYIKILQNAKEIILIDSVWAALVYLLDAKYKLFENIPIKVKCSRGYQEMFRKPIKLENWQIF